MNEEKVIKHILFRINDIKRRIKEFKDIPNSQEVIEALEKSKVHLERKLKAMRNQLYINLADYQGGDFAVGYCGTLKQWREKAMDWSDTDGLKETYNALKNYKIKNCDLIYYINDVWEISIEEFNPTIEYDLEVVYLD